MIVPDVNLLVYAYDASSPFHPSAKQWWEQSLSGNEPVGLVHPVLFGFVRICTNRRIFTNPMSLAQASEHVMSWLARHNVIVLQEEHAHCARVLELLREASAEGGNLVTDAQIAALALANNATVYTADKDFLRFPRLKTRFPLSPD